MYIIITSRPESAAFAISELQQYDNAVRPVKDLQPGVKLVFLPNGYNKLIAEKPPFIFIRHLFPVQYEGETNDVAVLFENIQWPEQTAGLFSVQVRGNIHAEMIQTIEEKLTQMGFDKNDKHPDWVLSLYVCENTMYAGVSSAVDNRSVYNGGARRYSRTGDGNFISRAEFKLMEAIETFQIKINTDTRALDLGAAPGGWTKVLLDAGCRVTAVDPGLLDNRIKTHPNLLYINATALRFFAALSPDVTFDLIVNDMKMDMYDSIRMMIHAADFLSHSGAAVMTLKLAKGQGLSKINKALVLLEKKYRVTDTRQLFHNRDEVCVYLMAKPAL
jgi:23S rRNA (cytidine2498-2'-O)-methyltransferase